MIRANLRSLFALFLAMSSGPRLDAQPTGSPKQLTAPSPLAEPVAGDPSNPSLSDDGRYLFFLGSAEDHLPGDGGFLQAYRRDLPAQLTRRVSIDAPDATSRGGNVVSVLGSATGHQAAFARESRNLLGETPIEGIELFWIDLETPDALPVPITGARRAGPVPGLTELAAVSQEGRQVLFVSETPDLVEGDTNGLADVFLWDETTRSIELVSIATNGLASAGLSAMPVMTTDARWIAFESTASNLVSGNLDLRRGNDVYLRDRVERTTRLISRLPDARTFTRDAYGPSISPDGAWVAFVGPIVRADAAQTRGSAVFVWERATDTLTQLPESVPLSSDINAAPAVFSSNSRWLAYADKGVVLSWNLTARTASLLSTNLAGAPSTNHLGVPLRISDDGDEVDFLSSYTGFFADALPPGTRWFRHAASTGRIRLMSLGATGGPSGEVLAIDFDREGRHVAFESSRPRVRPSDIDGAPGIRVGPVAGPLRDPLPGAIPGDASPFRVRLPRHGGLLDSPSAPVGTGLLSPDGRQILLTVAGGAVGAPSNTWQLIVKDLAGPAWTLVSRATNGLGSLGGPFLDAQFTPDGTSVVFSSQAGDLVPGDTNGLADVFEFQFSARTNRLLSRSPSGIAVRGHSQRASVAPDGSSVVFASFASNLLAQSVAPGLRLLRVVRDTGDLTSLLLQPGNTNQSLSRPALRTHATLGPLAFLDLGSDAANGAGHALWQVALASGDAPRRLDTNVLGPDGAVVSLGAYAPSVSSDGNRVAFEIRHLHPRLRARVTSIALWDRHSAEPARIVSLDRDGGTLPADASGPQLSPDGQHLLFRTSWSEVNQLVKGNSRVDANGGSDLFLRRLGTGTTELVSANLAGTGTGNGPSYDARFSPDGRWLLFTSRAGDLAAPELDRRPRIHLHDLQQHRTWRLETESGQPPGSGVAAVWSDDGRSIFFEGQTTDGSPAVHWLRLGGGDADGDGLDDDWEVTYFGNLARDGTADADADGASDRDEFRAGTDPTNQGSVFRVIIVRELVGAAATVHWPSITGRRYSVETKASLEVPWIRVSTPVTAQGTTSRWSLPTLEPTAFVRVVAD